MTLAQILEQTGWPEIKAALLWSYPDAQASLDDYRAVLDQLRKLIPERSDMRIFLRETDQAGVGERPIIEVVGRNGERNRDRSDYEHFRETMGAEFADAETEYSLCMEPWQRWLGMVVDAQVRAGFSPPQVIAHCLWEMTFHGFEPSQIQQAREELEQLSREVGALSDAERKTQLVPLEEAIKGPGPRQTDE